MGSTFDKLMHIAAMMCHVWVVNIFVISLVVQQNHYS